MFIKPLTRSWGAKAFEWPAIANGTQHTRLILGQQELDLEQYTNWSFDDVVAGCHPGRMVSLDMNGDDFDDLVFLCGTANLMSVRFGSATLEEAAAWSGTLSVGAEHLASGDIDADGYDDLLTSGPYVFLGGESPTVTALAAFELATGESSHAVALADHNGDGLLDAIVNDTWYRGDMTLQPDFWSRMESFFQPRVHAAGSGALIRKQCTALPPLAEYSARLVRPRKGRPRRSGCVLLGIGIW